MTTMLQSELLRSSSATALVARRASMRDIELFTEINGDHHPLHYDADAARPRPFGELIVQGGVPSRLLNAIVAEGLPAPPPWCGPIEEPIRESVTYRGGVLVLPGALGIPTCEHASLRRSWTPRRR